MSELEKKPYKISIWGDRNVYITGLKKGDVNFDGIINNKDYTRLSKYLNLEEVEIDEWAADINNDNIIDNNDLEKIDSNSKREELNNNPILKPFKKKSILSENDIVLNQYLEEVCLATIGSNTMDTPIRAFNPILIEELNGSKTLTFEIFSKYWDDEIEQFKLNPFISLLVNERRIKLQYNDEWYDFVIKQIDEDSKSNIFTYTCKDLFINELGKTGYEVELDTELRNNMGTITELADSILEGTDWQVDKENCEDLIQRNKEGLYSYITESSIEATDILTQSPKTIPSGKVIFVFYSCKANSENPIQFLYKEQNQSSSVDEAIANFYKVDEYGFIVDANNYEFTYNGTLSNFYNGLVSSSYFGQKIIKKQEMHYLPQIDETCTVWKKNNERYYCYTELEYASIAQVQNMLSNSSGFISTNGWIGQVNLSTITTGEGYVERSINLSNSTYNTGFYDNRAALSPKGFVKNEKYIVAVKGITLTNNPYITLIGKTGISNVTPLTFNKSFDNQTYPFTIPSELEDYSVKMAVCSETISYSSIINNYGDIRFYLNNNGNLVDCKVFKYRTDSEDKMIVPDLEKDSNAIIQTRYNFFLESSIPNDAIYTKQDLIIAESLLDTTEGYEPVMIEDCKKVASLTGSKSNRFNLIQSLCETFECWAKFTIEHNNKGQIAYVYNKINNNAIKEGKRYYTWVGNDDAPPSSTDDFNFRIITEDMTPTPTTYYEKIYSKYVIFKEYIGDDNLVGFRYGINLQSIQRNIVSDQIASKVIVQANSNEFAPNGSCTIQQSVLNPTGENALYNFQYFINHGLLDATSLYDDLYGTNGGLGFYTKMKEYNDSIQPKINELSEISKSLYTLNSRQTVYDALMEEASRLRDENSLELNTIGYNKSRNYEQVNSPSGNPKKKGWYEVINNKYVLTSDKTVQSGKNYYKAKSVGAVDSSNAPEYVDELRNKIASYTNTIDYYETLSQRNKVLLTAYTQKYNTISESLRAVRALKDKLNQDFANKYYRFIQEGTWNSEDYWDPELYYQTANMVLYTSSFPQISYSINVLELSQIEGFEVYNFKIADKTYIEDTEFFGYDSKGRPYKEEIVVSQIKRHLDDNSQNTITVQNYKTQFQDLFQRIAAASQSLQYHEGSYQRAASAINNDGTINSALLQNSLEANALVIQNANNQSVTWDETGITISNFVNANDIVRLTSGGIVLSTDGGRNWTTGITGDGINADVITAGRIDADRIRIFNGAMQQTFEWNSTGINAYMSDNNIVNYGKFVRFDQYGLYGYAGGDPSWDPHIQDQDSQVIGIDKVIKNSMFSLTWKGLNINIPNSQDIPVITIGSEDHPVFQIDGSGDVTLAGDIALTGNITWGESNRPITTKALYAASKLSTPNTNIDYGENNNKIVKVEQYNSINYNSENGWKIDPTIENPKENYDGVYKSTNQDIHDSYSIAKITFKGFSTFTVYIRSYAGNLDYTIASTLDSNGFPTESTSPSAKVSTYEFQREGTTINDYKAVTYEIAQDKVENKHHIYIVYRKSPTGSSNNDSGYFLIPKSEENVWHTIFDPTFDTYVSYSYDNGDTWTSPMSASIDSQSVYDALIQNSNSKLGIFYVKSSDNNDNGQLYINADYIRAGSINADNISVTNLKVNNIVDSLGNRITSNNNIIQSSYLNLKGIEVKNGNTTTFQVDPDGKVTINGTVIMGANSTINWNNVTSSNIPYATSGELSTVSSNLNKLRNGTLSGGTFISGKNIYSPTIQADKFEVYAQSNGITTSPNGFYLYDASSSSAALQISYWDSTAPYIEFSSPWGGYALWNFTHTDVYGYVDFSNATVTGISGGGGTATAVFG